MFKFGYCERFTFLEGCNMVDKKYKDNGKGVYYNNKGRI